MTLDSLKLQSQNHIWNFVHTEKLTYKKTLVASEQDRADVARRRREWVKYRVGIDPARLVFIDET